MSKIHYSKDMKKCPYCDNEEFYVKQSFHGTCEYNMRFDMGADVENGDMWDNSTTKDLTKYAYCNNCNKRLFLMEEYYKVMFE